MDHHSFVSTSSGVNIVDAGGYTKQCTFFWFEGVWLGVLSVHFTYSACLKNMSTKNTRLLHDIHVMYSNIRWVTPFGIDPHTELQNFRRQFLPTMYSMIVCFQHPRGSDITIWLQKYSTFAHDQWSMNKWHKLCGFLLYQCLHILDHTSGLQCVKRKVKRSGPAPVIVYY